MKKNSTGFLVEIDISELVWDEQTDGSHQYACDRIDEFIDEISDQNKIIPHNFKEVDIDTPTILISLNNKLISYIRFNADEWDEDAMSLSLFLVLDFTSAEDINTYFLTEHDNKYISCYFPDVDKIVFQSYNRGTYCDFMKGFFNPSNQKKPEYYTNYNGDLEMRKLYNKAKSILVK
ncbi:hypothetical protein OAH77_03125 [Flavobacteriaceae bacterium]|nr:hypothetical protein [Flavobacteriaceae bacterium]